MTPPRFPRPCGACAALVFEEGCRHWRPGKAAARRTRGTKTMVPRKPTAAVDLAFLTHGQGAG